MVPPTEIQQPEVPAIGGTPDAITEVAPPLGWRGDDAAVGAFSGRSSRRKVCKTDPYSGVEVCGSESNVNEVLKEIEEGKLSLTGGNKIDLDADLDLAIEFIATVVEGLDLSLSDGDVTNVLNRLGSMNDRSKAQQIQDIKSFARSLYAMAAVDKAVASKAFTNFAHSVQSLGESSHRYTYYMNKALWAWLKTLDSQSIQLRG